MSIEEFADVNNLDDKCIEVLKLQPPEVQQYVISQGPAGGRSPSAIVMARIKKCGAGGHIQVPAAPPAGFDFDRIAQTVEEFISTNGLDDKCSELLRTQTVDCQVAVLNLGPADGRNASAMVMGRIARFQASVPIPGARGSSGSQWDVGAGGTSHGRLV